VSLAICAELRIGCSNLLSRKEHRVYAVLLLDRDTHMSRLYNYCVMYRA
jgi:hypothetical protein